jgi:hypothetical protein
VNLNKKSKASYKYKTKLTGWFYVVTKKINNNYIFPEFYTNITELQEISSIDLDGFVKIKFKCDVY